MFSPSQTTGKPTGLRVAVWAEPKEIPDTKAVMTHVHLSTKRVIHPRVAIVDMIRRIGSAK